jgi:hypothetical protein
MEYQIPDSNQNKQESSGVDLEVDYFIQWSMQRKCRNGICVTKILLQQTELKGWPLPKQLCQHNFWRYKILFENKISYRVP